MAPLEGLWSMSDPSVFEDAKKDQYEWTMMIMQPTWITDAIASEAAAARTAKRQLPALSKSRFEGTPRVGLYNSSTSARSTMRRQN